MHIDIQRTAVSRISEIPKGDLGFGSGLNRVFILMVLLKSFRPRLPCIMVNQYLKA